MNSQRVLSWAFLTCLVDLLTMPLLFFRFDFTISLTVGLAINGTELKGRNIVVKLFR